MQSNKFVSKYFWQLVISHGIKTLKIRQGNELFKDSFEDSVLKSELLYHAGNRIEWSRMGGGVEKNSTEQNTTQQGKEQGRK